MAAFNLSRKMSFPESKWQERTEKQEKEAEKYDQVVTEASEQMKHPIEEILEVANRLKHQIERQRTTDVVETDFTQVIQSLKRLNDYNQAIYKFAITGNKQLKAEPLRIISIWAKVKSELKQTQGIRLLLLLEDVYIMADAHFLKGVLQDTILDLAKRTGGPLSRTFEIHGRVQEQELILHISGEKRAHAHDLYSTTPPSDPQIRDMDLMILKRQIGRMNGRIELSDNQGEMQYIVSFPILK
ncbi:MAG: hypothetical protein AAFQ83_00520 [Bacteroidota bacterium]